MPKPNEFSLFDEVIKDRGDYTFEGKIVAAFRKKSGVWRYVVENEAGILHIFSATNLRNKEKNY